MNKYLVIIAFAFFHCVGPPEPEDGLIDNLSSIINTADVFSFSLRGDKYDFNESYVLSFFLDSNSVLSTTLIINEFSGTKNAEVFFYNSGELFIEIKQRTPIARVLHENGYLSYYIDKEGKVMALSNNYVARVPVFNGHSEAVFLKISNKASREDIIEAVQGNEGISVMDNPDTLEYPTPYEQANDSEDVYVGRIRSQDIQGDTWISLWIVADNVYGKGAALNAVQILQKLIANNKLC